jgi:hypothetical protein
MPTAMRDSNRPAFRGRGRPLAPMLVVALVVTSLVAACGGTSATPTPAPSRAAATRAPAADPHLTSPTTLEVVYKALQAAGLKIVADTAASGRNGKEPQRKLIATYEGWPLIISEFSTAKALSKATKWKRGKRPGQGEPPFALKGLNILIEWGPTTGRRPPKPDARQKQAIAAIVTALDPLIYPLVARSSVSVDVPVHTPVPKASPADGGPQPLDPATTSRRSTSGSSSTSRPTVGGPSPRSRPISGCPRRPCAPGRTGSSSAASSRWSA